MHMLEKKMVCSSRGFLQLESLEMAGLNDLDELIVEKGVMSNLKTPIISGREKMKKLPHGLLQSTNPKNLLLRLSCHESIEEKKVTGGEDWYKLHKIMH